MSMYVMGGVMGMYSIYLSALYKLLFFYMCVSQPQSPYIIQQPHKAPTYSYNYLPYGFSKCVSRVVTDFIQ